MLAHLAATRREIKRRVAPVLHRTGYLSGVSTLLARYQRVMRVIMFHSIGTDDYPVDMFRQQLLYLKRRFVIIGLDELLDRCESSGHQIALTFDDGLRNNITHAYPVLRALSIPATFFVCPGLIENHKWLWTYESNERLRWMATGERVSLAREWGRAEHDPRSMGDWIRTLSSAQREAAIDQLRSATRGFEPTPLQHLTYDTMGWDELLATDSKLITVGSHTVSHPILTTCTPEELSREIQGSQRWLEERLQRPVRHFCYPNAAQDDRVVQMVRSYYRSAVAGVGFVTPYSDHHRLPRIPAASSLQYLAWRLHRPEA